MSTLPSWARVGAKVVCIDVAPRSWPTDTLNLGAVYTVAGVGVSPSGKPCLFLRETQSTLIWANGQRAGYYFDRFRPAVEPKSEAHDLAQFRKLLNARQPEGVDA